MGMVLLYGGTPRDYKRLRGVVRPHKLAAADFSSVPWRDRTPAAGRILIMRGSREEADRSLGALEPRRGTPLICCCDGFSSAPTEALVKKHAGVLWPLPETISSRSFRRYWRELIEELSIPRGNS